MRLTDFAALLLEPLSVTPIPQEPLLPALRRLETGLGSIFSELISIQSTFRARLEAFIESRTANDSDPETPRPRRTDGLNVIRITDVDITPDIVSWLEERLHEVVIDPPPAAAEPDCEFQLSGSRNQNFNAVLSRVFTGDGLQWFREHLP